MAGKGSSCFETTYILWDIFLLMATNLDILESELKNEVYGLEKELAVLGKREGYKKRVF